ncbi:MAG: DMT family transporter [Sphingomonadaceae bacterium]
MIGELLALTSAFTWALVSVLLRVLQTRANALSLNAFRSLVAAIVTAGVVVATGRLEAVAHFSPSTVFILVASVLVGMGIGDTLYFYSLRLVGVVRGLILSNAYPVFAAIMAAAFLGERMSVGLLVGTMLVVFGVALVLVPSRGLLLKSTVEPGKNVRLGVALALAAALFWACATVLVRVGAQETDGVAATSLRLIAASVALMVASGLSRSGLQTPKYRGRQLLGILAAGVVTAATSVTFLLAVQYTGAAKTATLTSTAPLFGAPMSLLMGERLTWQTLVGCVVSVVGIWLVMAG